MEERLSQLPSKLDVRQRISRHTVKTENDITSPSFDLVQCSKQLRTASSKPEISSSTPILLRCVNNNHFHNINHNAAMVPPFTAKKYNNVLPHIPNHHIQQAGQHHQADNTSMSQSTTFSIKGSFMGLPSTFNPREETNMSSTEKVNRWLNNLSYIYDEDDVMYMECYPGTANHSISIATMDSFHSFDLASVDGIIEFQARTLTRYATRLYLNESELVCHPDSVQYYNNAYYSYDEYSIMQYHGMEQSLLDHDESIDRYVKNRDENAMQHTC